MSQDKEVLNGIIDALGISGNLFVLWDKNKTFVKCDNIIREKLKSVGQNFENDLDVNFFIKT